MLTHPSFHPSLHAGSRRRTPPWIASVLSLVLALPVMASTDLVAQQVPSPRDFLGWDLGERFTDEGEVRRYMDALAEASELVTVHVYGRTNEGRDLVQVVIARPEFRDRMDQILDENRELTDPETTEGRAGEIIRNNPGVVYFSYGVHGNESSSSEAAMWTAWDLARGSEDTAGVLDSLVVVLDPVVNPDGRARYVSHFRQSVGPAPNPSPQAREHREPWPGGRYNHYLFDLNRDWAWMTQVETRARLATWDRWTPLVHVDFHEMGWRSEYFFFPAAKPINPIFPDHILEWGERFGRGNAAAFDAEGWLYFTGQNYDLFYPGYGDSWPSLNGAIGMTYEQAGGGFGGLGVERPDGTMLTLRDRAMHHWTAGKATLRTAAMGKTDLMSGFARFHRNVDQGFTDVLLVPRPGDGSLAELADLLLRQGIRLQIAGEGFRTEATTHTGFEPRRDFPRGTIRVDPRQPRGRLAMALVWPEFFLDAEFSYDISSWSLPYAFGVEAHAAASVPSAGWTTLEKAERPGTSASGAAASGNYGYLVRPDFAWTPELMDFLEAGGVAYAMADTFSLGGEAYPRGTVFLPRGFNPDLEDHLRTAGLTPFATPISTGLTEGGPDLGSGDRSALTFPSVALLSGEGTTPTSMGAHWYFLDHVLEIPFDAIQVGDLGSLDLSEYDVIISPSGGGIRRVMGSGGFQALEDWIQHGGTFVAVDAAARALGEELAEVGVRRDSADDRQGEERLERALRTREERDRDRWLEDVPGTILPLTLDPSHPLAYGAGADGSPEMAFALSQGQGFEPDERFETVAHFPGDLTKISGVISEESLERLDRSAWLVQARRGGGRVILFADDPLFRGFWYQGFQFYANAILMGGG